MLDPDLGRDPVKMATALKHLPDQQPPSVISIPGLLDGHENVASLIRHRLETPVLMEA
jgi:hypothetical protein